MNGRFGTAMAFLFGKEPRKPEVALVLALGLGGGVAAALAGSPWGWSPVQRAVGFLLAADILGGVAANRTVSTDRFYARGGRPLRFSFLGIHILQPLLLWAAFPEIGPRAPLALWGMSAVFATAVILADGKPWQDALGAGLAALGSAAGVLAFGRPDLAWFPVLYCHKLVSSFAPVRFPGAVSKDRTIRD